METLDQHSLFPIPIPPNWPPPPSLILARCPPLLSPKRSAVDPLPARTPPARPPPAVPPCARTTSLGAARPPSLCEPAPPNPPPLPTQLRRCARSRPGSRAPPPLPHLDRRHRSRPPSWCACVSAARQASGSGRIEDSGATAQRRPHGRRVWITRWVPVTRAGGGYGELLGPPQVMGRVTGLEILTGGGCGFLPHRVFHPLPSPGWRDAGRRTADAGRTGTVSAGPAGA
jgi:hypothetical protein